MLGRGKYVKVLDSFTWKDLLNGVYLIIILLELREQVTWIFGGRALQVDEILSAKALVCLMNKEYL